QKYLSNQPFKFALLPSKTYIEKAWPRRDELIRLYVDFPVRDVMNLKFQWALFVFALFTLSIPARAQFGANSGTNSISVNGEAEVRVVPDEVILTLGVETFDKILKSAKSLNDERIKKTISVAIGYGVPGEYIQTDYIGIEPRYQHGDITQNLLGYV